jgi:2-hydroxy-3-keto-5-methylthiopentenyl-1-phosphate phosphatase
MIRKNFLFKVAICYYFDGTLAYGNMQEYDFMSNLKIEASEFWNKSDTLAAEQKADSNLAYMWTMLEEAKKFGTTREDFLACGKNIRMFKGVDTWFERIREFGKERGVKVEHYIISSGLKEMIEGTVVAKNGAFERIYASSFYYNERGVAEWPAQIVNYTNKTQFLFRIQKGVLDVNDPGVNDYFAPEQIRVPFRNIVYLGDSATDIPCMKLVNSYGGHSIGVFNPDTKDKGRVYKMLNENRIKYFAEADYSEGSELDTLVKAIIERTVANERLEGIHFENKKEAKGDKND